MGVDPQRASRWRAVVLAAVVLSQAGCQAGGPLWRDRGGKAALDQVRLKDPDQTPPAPGSGKAHTPAAPKDDLLRRYEAETTGKDGEPAARPRPLTKKEREREEVLDDLHEHFRKQAEDAAPGEAPSP